MRRLAWTLSTAALAGSTFAQATFTRIDGPSDLPSILPRAMTPDGATIVGDAARFDDAGHATARRAFVYTAQSGVRLLDAPPSLPPNISATCISADGRWAAGGAAHPSGSGASIPLRWNLATGEASVLETAQDISIYFITSITQDGSTVAGWTGQDGPGHPTIDLRSMTWDANGRISILTPFRPGESLAQLTLSRDGLIRAATSSMSPAQDGQSLILITNTGPIYAGHPQGVFGCSGEIMFALAGDGSTIIGLNCNNDGFAWSAAIGFRRLMPLPNQGQLHESWPSAISFDGRVIVGNAPAGEVDSDLVLWDGPRVSNLYAAFASSGIDLSEWQETSLTPRAISDNAQIITGSGIFRGEYRGFLITLAATDSAICYANCDGSTSSPQLNASDFVCFLSRFRADAALSPAFQYSSYSNCDGSTTPPTLDASDFRCFLDRFRAGCR